MENEQKEHLLSPEEAIHNDDEIVAKRQKLHLPRLQNPLLLILLLVSFGFNVFLFSYQFVKHNRYLSHNGEHHQHLSRRFSVSKLIIAKPVLNKMPSSCSAGDTLRTRTPTKLFATRPGPAST